MLRKCVTLFTGTALLLSSSAYAVTLTAQQAEDAISGKNNNNFFGTGFSAAGENEVGSQRSANNDPTNQRAARTFVEFQLTAGLIAEAQAALGTGKRAQLDFNVSQIVNFQNRLEGLDIRYFGVAAADRSANTLWNTGAIETAHNVVYGNSSPGAYTGSFSNAKVVADIAAATPGQVIAFGLVNDLGVDNGAVVAGAAERHVYILPEANANYSLSIGQALRLVTPTSITQTASDTLAGFAAANLINNSGFASTPNVSNFTSVAYNSAPASNQWVTASTGFPNYFDAGQPNPQFTMALGGRFDLTDLVVWGYSTTNANEASDFLVEFSTDGGASYYGGRTVQTSFHLGDGNAVLTFGGTFSANFIRLTMLDNTDGRNLTGLPGGDRVGLGEIKFLATVIPEPGTALLAAMSLAGLAMRRRRA